MPETVAATPGPRRVRCGDIPGALAALHDDGAVIVENFIPAAVVDRLNSELAPHVDSRGGGFRGADDEFYGSNTVRIQGLARKCPSFVHEILLHDMLLDVADEVLLPNCGSYWMSQAETIFIGPGSPAQPLHRDDLNWSLVSELNVDLQVSALVALGDYDAEVGATVVDPGSHAGAGRGPVPAEMHPGDAMIYTGRVWHGGGANTTDDRWRKALYIGIIASWLTPEEAVAASLDAETIERLPHRARPLLGWGAQEGNPAASGDDTSRALRLWQMDESDLDRLGHGFVQD